MNWEDLQSEIPLENLRDALDDDHDGFADPVVWAAVLASARERATNAFGGSVPAQYASAEAYALKIFACEIVYGRRGYSGDRNPFTARANAQEKRLAGLANGNDRPDTTPGGAVADTVPLRTSPSSGNLV